jgi:hypothetical protein
VTICAGRQELDASSRRSSKMARSWRCLYPAVDYSDDDDDDDDDLDSVEVLVYLRFLRS